MILLSQGHLVQGSGILGGSLQTSSSVARCISCTASAQKRAGWSTLVELAEAIGRLCCAWWSFRTFLWPVWMVLVPFSCSCHRDSEGGPWIFLDLTVTVLTSCDPKHLLMVSHLQFLPVGNPRIPVPKGRSGLPCSWWCPVTVLGLWHMLIK